MNKKDPQDRDPLATIVISLDEYVEFVRKSDVLNALEAAGVDNWEGYDYAMELLDDEDE